MVHRKQKHIESVANCRKKRDENCPFSDEKCWWNHKNRQANKYNIKQIECYFCDKIFENKPSLMKHRNAEHRSVVRRCDKYMGNNCPFQSIDCWYLHDDEHMEIEELDAKFQEKETIKSSVFQSLFTHIKPPINQKKD